MIRAFLYDAEGRDREIALEAGVADGLAEHHMLWLDVTAPTARELETLKGLFSLSTDAVAALAAPATRHSLDNYGDYFLLDVPAIVRQQAGPTALNSRDFVPLLFVVSAQWLITLHAKDVGFLQRFRDQDKGETLIGALSGPAVAASLLDWHLAAYLDALEDLEHFADGLDERMLRVGAVRDTLLGELVAGRRFIANLRRALGPQRAVFYGLSRPDFALVAGSDAASSYAGLERRYERVLDAIDHGRELMRSSFDLFSTRTAEITNTLLRRLTFLSVALGAAGAVTGVFAMNFEAPPYAKWGALGFWGVVAAMTIAVVIAALVGRARKWF
jgi:Mg2+ and Co2+ transporter CorA